MTAGFCALATRHSLTAKSITHFLSLRSALEYVCARLSKVHHQKLLQFCRQSAPQAPQAKFPARGNVRGWGRGRGLVDVEVRMGQVIGEVLGKEIWRSRMF
jgi:hypothetical protein